MFGLTGGALRQHPGLVATLRDVQFTLTGHLSAGQE